MALFALRLDIAKALIKYGAKVETPCGSEMGNMNVMHIAIRSKNLSMVAFLLDHISIDQPTLQFCIRFGTGEILDALLKQLSSFDSNPIDVLFDFAMREGSDEMTLSLLNNTAFDIAATQQGATGYLHVAIKRNLFGVAEALMQRSDCDVAAIDASGDTPLLALLKDEDKKQLGAAPNHLGFGAGQPQMGVGAEEPVSPKKLSLILALVARENAGINTANAKGFVALVQAFEAEKRFPGVAQKLLENQFCNVNLCNPVSKQTPLHLSIIKGNMIAFATLLNRPDCDVNAIDGSGMSALHLAAQHGSIRGIKDLIAKGANVRQLNNNGQSPLLVAMDHYTRSSFFRGIGQWFEVQRLLSV